MNRVHLFSVCVILLVVSGCGMSEPEDMMEFPLHPNVWHIKTPKLPLHSCLGLCPDYEALR
jgi:hypothetical protein